MSDLSKFKQCLALLSGGFISADIGAEPKEQLEGAQHSCLQLPGLGCDCLPSVVGPSSVSVLEIQES